jgi:hypothetical protein
LRVTACYATILLVSAHVLAAVCRQTEVATTMHLDDAKRIVLGLAEFVQVGLSRVVSCRNTCRRPHSIAASNSLAMIHLLWQFFT